MCVVLIICLLRLDAANGCQTLTQVYREYLRRRHIHCLDHTVHIQLQSSASWLSQQLLVAASMSSTQQCLRPSNPSWPRPMANPSSSISHLSPNRISTQISSPRPSRRDYEIARPILQEYSETQSEGQRCRTHYHPLHPAQEALESHSHSALRPGKTRHTKSRNGELRSQKC